LKHGNDLEIGSSNGRENATPYRNERKYKDHPMALLEALKEDGARTEACRNENKNGSDPNSTSLIPFGNIVHQHGILS